MQRFNHHNHGQHSLVRQYGGHGAKRVVVVNQHAHLDQHMRSLRVMCHQLLPHPVPVLMKFIAEVESRTGQPMAVYACNFAGCQRRQGWIRDRRTGKPIRLWEGKHKA